MMVFRCQNGSSGDTSSLLKAQVADWMDNYWSGKCAWSWKQATCRRLGTAPMRDYFALVKTAASGIGPLGSSLHTAS
jgi:hypothetical protein